MGDEVLKHLRLTLFALFLVSTLNAKNSSIEEETKMYDTLFDAINTKRFGLDDIAFKKMKDPFVRLPQKTSPKSSKTSPKKPIFRLHAIMENRAKINQSWVKKGDKINNYRLTKLTGNSAVLSNQERTLTLMLSKKGQKNVAISSH